MTNWWRLFLPHVRIRVRIVAAVVLAMTLVLVGSSAFVYWRVSFALDRQLNQDLAAYSDLISKQVAAGHPLPADNPGEVSQTYSATGAVTGRSDKHTQNLLSRDQVTNAASSPQRFDLGSMIPTSSHPYRVLYFTVKTPLGRIVVATAISRHKHDEALRELLGQLLLADLATVVAAGVVGWAATRAALGPVERYRRAAQAAGGDPTRRLPVDTDHDDELTRLGSTFNTLLDEIEEGHARERQFLADASHELRSPLALLAAEVEWAQHRPRSPEQLDEVLASVAKQTERLVELADALLDLEEANDRSQVRRVPAPLDQVISDAVAPHLRPAASLKREIQVTCPETVVEIEARWVEVAVSNLVANALRHGLGVVTVEATVVSHQLDIVVTDEGVGIPDALGTNAFDRFARADTARTTPGSGLGLAIVAAVVERHGGQVTLVPGGLRLRIPVPENSRERGNSE